MSTFFYMSTYADHKYIANRSSSDGHDEHCSRRLTSVYAYEGSIPVLVSWTDARAVVTGSGRNAVTSEWSTTGVICRYTRHAGHVVAPTKFGYWVYYMFVLAIRIILHGTQTNVWSTGYAT